MSESRRTSKFTVVRPDGQDTRESIAHVLIIIPQGSGPPLLLHQITRRSLRIAKQLSVTTRESTAPAGTSRIPSENADHPLSQVARPAHSNRKRPKFNNDGPEDSDDDDNYRNESNDAQLKCNKRRRTKMPDEFRGVRGKLGLLEKLARDVPLDIMFEVPSLCHPKAAAECFLALNLLLSKPNDLINLARTTRDLRGIVISKSSELIWRTARSNLDGLPPLPKDLSESQYAALLICTHCYVSITSSMSIPTNR